MKRLHAANGPASRGLTTVVDGIRYAISHAFEISHTKYNQIPESYLSRLERYTHQEKPGETNELDCLTTQVKCRIDFF